MVTFKPGQVVRCTDPDVPECRLTELDLDRSPLVEGKLYVVESVIECEFSSARGVTLVDVPNVVGTDGFLASRFEAAL